MCSSHLRAASSPASALPARASLGASLLKTRQVMPSSSPAGKLETPCVCGGGGGVDIYLSISAFAVRLRQGSLIDFDGTDERKENTFPLPRDIPGLLRRFMLAQVEGAIQLPCILDDSFSALRTKRTHLPL